MNKEIFELGSSETSVKNDLSTSQFTHDIEAISTDSVVSIDNELLEQIEKVPKKMAFKIGEVAEIADVKQYVLRYWESEFEILRPKKSSHNQRMFSRKDVETVLLIKKLLYRDRFSISGARAAIRKLRQQVQSSEPQRVNLRMQTAALEKARTLLKDIRKLRAAMFN